GRSPPRLRRGGPVVRRARRADQPGIAVTIGLLSVVPPRLPLPRASPKGKTPPSDATRTYPLPCGEAIMATIGLLRVRLPVLPKPRASPKGQIPPSLATSQ